MKAIVIGGDGGVGKALVEALLDKGYPVTSTTRRSRTSALVQESAHHQVVRLDLLSDIAPFLPIVTKDVTEVVWVFLVAAIAGITACEDNAAESWRVNADAPVALARNAFEYKYNVAFISSDAVERAPRLNYSTQKAYVESFVLARGGLVLRPGPMRSDMDRVDFVERLICCAEMDGRGVVRWP